MPNDDQTLQVVLPQFFPAHWLEEAPDLVHTEFPSRIRIGYVIRKDGAYSYVMRPDLERMGVSVSELHASALKSLAALPVNGVAVGKTPGGSEAFLADIEDNFRAVRILLPRIHEALTRELGDEYLVAIPCRDWFVAWSKNQLPEWQQRNVASALKDFLEDDSNLTPDILLRSQGGFSVFKEQRTEV